MHWKTSSIGSVKFEVAPSAERYVLPAVSVVSRQAPSGAY